MSYKRSQKKFLILDLLASNCTIGSFSQLIQLCTTLHTLETLDLILLHSVAYKKEVQLIDQCFLTVSVLVF